MSIADSLGWCLCSRAPLLALLDVCLNIEVSEESNEGDGISNESIVHPLGKVAVNVERVEGMYNGETELQLCVRGAGGGNITSSLCTHTTCNSYQRHTSALG